MEYFLENIFYKIDAVYEKKNEQPWGDKSRHHFS